MLYTFPTCTRGSRLTLDTQTTVLVADSALRIICTGGRRRELPVTDAAGVVSTLLTLRCGDPSRTMAMAGRTISIRKASVKLLPKSYISMGALIYNVLLSSNGSTTGITTCTISNNLSRFATLVGRETGRLGVGSASFRAPSKLSDRGRCSATCSVTLLKTRTVGGPRFLDVYSGGDVDIDCNGPPCHEAIAGRGELLAVSRSYVKVGANFAGGDNEYLISTIEHNNMALVTIALGTPSS